MGSWSIILNVLLLAGVLVGFIRSVFLRRVSIRKSDEQPMLGQAGDRPSELSQYDDIIAVRKVSQNNQEVTVPIISHKPEAQKIQPSVHSEKTGEGEPLIMMFLLAKDDRKLAGYELLQTLLAAGLRFGEGHLFHRHQHSNGQGPVLCSVAAATSSGLFDMQNIGAFSVRGLCIFMKPSESPMIDAERFAIMLDTARQLSDDLDAYLLDDRRQPLTEEAIARYRSLLSIELVSELEPA
jgi:cell division protein ZipA